MLQVDVELDLSWSVQKRVVDKTLETHLLGMMILKLLA